MTQPDDKPPIETPATQSMIKGHQVQLLKDRRVQLTLQRNIPDLPPGVTDVPFREWRKRFEAYCFAMPPGWWLFTWPVLKGRINIMIAKEVAEEFEDDAACRLQVRDDIVIDVYSTNDASIRIAHMRIPLDYWANHIDTITEVAVTIARKAYLDQTPVREEMSPYL